MTYTPTKKNNKAKIISTAMLICGLAVWLFSIAVDIAYPFAAQFLAVTLICACLAIASRWIFCVYTYSIVRGELVVTQLNRGATDVFRLPLSSLVSLEKGKTKASGKCYNYTVTFAVEPSDCYTAVFEYSGEKITAYLECDSAFASALKNIS